MKSFIQKISMVLLLCNTLLLEATPGVTDAQNLAIAIQSNGSIITAGYVTLNSLTQFSVVRYTSLGIPDTTYGSNGYVATAFGSAAEAAGVALLSNNEAVAAGFGEPPAGTSFAIGLFTTAGALDTTFNGTGTNTTLIGAGSAAHGVVIDSSGNYVTAGIAVVGGTPVTALARYTSAGILDSTFGTGGTVTTQIGDRSEGFAVALQSAGQIVVAGFAEVSGVSNFAVAQYTTSGSLDTTFNSTGVLPGTVTTAIGSQAAAYAIAIQPADGKIVLGGVSSNTFALVRYNTDGSLDTSFGTGGIVTTTITGSSNSQINGLAIQSNGAIVAVGFAGNSLAVARYTSSGSLDTTFNSSGSQPGVVTSAIGDYAVGTCVALNSSSQIVVGGYSDQGALVVRYTTAGVLDVTFGTNGYTSFPNSSVGPDIFGLTSANLAPDAGVLYSQLSLTNSIVNSDINTSAAIADTKLGTIQTAGKVLNSATTATSANTASAIVARDALGNFSANTITASLVGNVSGSASNNLLKSGDTLSGSLVLAPGSASNPSLQFSGSANSGFSATGNSVTLSTNGLARLAVNNNGAVSINNPSSGLGLTVGGGAAVNGNIAATGNIQFNTSGTTLNTVGSTQGPLLKIYWGTGNSGSGGSTTINYTAAGFTSTPQVYLTSINGLINALGVSSVTNTAATILSVANIPFNYLAIGI